MNKSEIIDSVIELMQDKSAAARGLAGRWTNFVLDDLAGRGLLHSLQREEKAALVPGSGTDMNTGRNYDLNVDTDKVFKAFIPALGIDGILTKVSNDRLLEKMALDGYTLRGKPEFYTIFAVRTLRLHPIPSSTYAPAIPTELEKIHVWKYKDPAHLTENDQITEFKIKHTPCIVEGAYAYGTRFDDLGDFAAAQARYEQMIVRLFTDQDVELDRPRQTAYNDY